MKEWHWADLLDQIKQLGMEGWETPAVIKATLACVLRNPSRYDGMEFYKALDLAFDDGATLLWNQVRYS